MKQKDKLYEGISVLIFGAGGRQALPMCRGFYNLGCKVTVYCHSKLDTGYLTRFTNAKILYDKRNKENEDFLNYGLRFIKSGAFDLVVPLGDHTATFLSQHKEDLKQYAKIAVNDWDVFQYAIDKSKTMHICMKEGVPSPKTLEGDNQLEKIKKGALSFPLVVKPKTAVGSIGFNIFKDFESLEVYLRNYNNENGELIIQEYIEQGKQPQYRADLFRDRDGKFKAAIVGKVTRWYPLDGGSGIFVYTIHDDEIVNNCKKLLDAINWNGYANIDLVWDIANNCAKILEINGRTGATIKQDFLSGINISQLILENELGLEVEDMSKYEDGAQMTCFLPDLLWFIKSPDRFNTTPSWFNRFGVKDSIFSIDDPLPSIGFIIQSVVSYRESMRKRRRS